MKLRSGLPGTGQLRRRVNKLNARLRGYILHALCEGMSQRSCERIFGVSQNTVAKLFEEAGDMAIAYIRSMKDLAIAKIQADELHAFVGAREQNAKSMEVPTPGAGQVWTYLAMCAETKLIFAYHLGDQTLEDATIFVRRVASKLKRKSGGEFTVRPTVVTDGLRAYPEAMERGFGSDLNFGILSKQYSKVDGEGNKVTGGRYEGATRIVAKGQVAESEIHTSYIERQNLNVRMAVRRYGRKTNAFSKRLVNHERHLALWIVYHNLCWVPRPKAPFEKFDRDGKRKPWVKVMPAGIAAGITKHLYEIKDLLALTDAFVAERKRLAHEAEAEVEAAAHTVVVDAHDVELAPTHWVYRSFRHRSTKTHAAGCSNCRDGAGKKGAGGTSNGEWLPFYGLDDATATAERLEPDRHSICNMCLGQYRKLGRGR